MRSVDEIRRCDCKQAGNPRHRAAILSRFGRSQTIILKRLHCFSWTDNGAYFGYAWFWGDERPPPIAFGSPEWALQQAEEAFRAASLPVRYVLTQSFLS